MAENGTFRAQSACLPLALLCLAALSSACGDGDALRGSSARAIPGCEKLDLTPCDVLDHDCQVSRFAIAACLRETAVSGLPSVSVMTEQAYVDYIAALYVGRQFPKTNHFEVAMNWLGLAAPGTFAYVPLETADIADWFGTYRWREKDLVIIDHGRPAADEASNVELVAAQIRALRDRDIDIGPWSSRVSIIDEDTRWGADAMYFGEARFYSNRYQAALHGLDPAHFDALAQINAGIRDDIDWIRKQPSSFVATNDRFPENFGARYMCLAWQKDGPAGINALYDSSLFTHQLMAAETEAAPAPPVTHHLEPVAPSSWVEDPSITGLGAWGLFLSSSRTLETDAAWSLALGWSGDRIYVYKAVEPSEDTALVWQLEMADEASAISLQAALSEGNPTAQIRRIASFVTLAMTTNEDTLDWAFVAD